MKPNWIRISDRWPDENQKVLISDGYTISMATTWLSLVKGVLWFTGCGFSGYEWDWSFEPTHWAEIPELPTI